MPLRLSPFISLCVLLLAGAAVNAHPVPIAQASVQIDTKAGTFELRLDCDVTTFIMGAEPGHLGDELAAQLGAMTDAELKREVERKREWFATQFEARVNGKEIEPAEIVFPPLADIREVTEARGGGFDTQHSRITVRGRLGGAVTITFRFPRELGTVLLTARRDTANLTPQLLAAGQPSIALELRGKTDTLPKVAGADDPGDPAPKAEDAGDPIPQSVYIVGQFLALGFWHIIPTGPDHILFVLGLFLLSPTLKPLLWQVTAFTIAHSVTLALAMNGVVNLPPRIVEPLIAASIAFVAIENLFTSKLHPWRPIIVFAFGLLHGLGFAGVMAELKLPDGQFVPALVGFNIGVELGQLAVIVGAMLAVGWFRKSSEYRWRVVVPASLAIAAIGVYWTIQRTMM
jgi:hypothetical protein